MTYAEAEASSRRLAKRMIAAGMGKGTARRPVLHVRPGVGGRVAGGEPHRRARDAARDHVPPGRDPQGAAHRRHRHADHRAHGARHTTCRRCSRTACPVSPRRRDSPPLPPRDAVAARGLDHRRHRPRAGRRRRSRSRGRSTSARSVRRPAATRSRPRWCPADLAQVTYTSGSSADPKGVVHTHGTVVRATGGLAALQAAGDEPARVLLRLPVLLDRRHARPRRRAAVGHDRARASSASSPAPRSTSSSASGRPRCSAGRRCSSRCATTRRSPTASSPRSRASPSARPTSR